MIHFLISLMISFGAVDIHVNENCHRGDWCRGTALAVMPYSGNPYQRVTFKAWPPYFQPVIVTPVQAVTKEYIEQAQYGPAQKRDL